MTDDANGTLQQLAQVITRSLEPLRTRLAAGDARTLLAEMGLSLPASLDGLPAFSSATAAAITAVENLAGPLAALASAAAADDISAILSATVSLLQAVGAVVTELSNVATALSSLANSLAGVSPADVTAFAGTLGEKLVEHVVIDYLAGYLPVLLRVLALVGFVNIDLVPPAIGDPAKVAYQRHDLTLANVGNMLGDPAGYLSSLYGWNTPALKSADLLDRIGDLLTDFGVPASFDKTAGLLRLAPLTVGPTSTNPPGLSLELAWQVTDGVTVPLPSLLPRSWTVQLVAKGTLDAGVELRIVPPGQLEVHAAARPRVQAADRARHRRRRRPGHRRWLHLLRPGQGEYAGVLELSLLSISIKAIGVLDTKLPDGSPGFSFLIILTFDLPPIQLGFGFTLNGLGGLCGINRTMVLDALRDAMRAHHLDSILFPPDPVKDAPQIISDIRTIFPPAQGRYVFGPMLEIGWGTPSLLTLEVGVILEVPDPVRIALLGRLHMALPDDDAALILVQIDILGTLDFGIKLLTIDGSLYDSHVLLYQLYGDMALRLSWGDHPDFAVSMGGFHPRFTPPPGFPALRRMTVSISAGDFVQLSCTSYMAVTTNSFQFGAAVDARASAGGFSVHGYIGFDVLFIFNPFGFDADFSAGVDVQFEGVTLLGIHLDAELSGPTPWHVHGSASLEILFFSVSASVDLTWGDDHAVSLPATPVLPQLHAALIAPGSWSAQLPAGAEQAVTLRGLPPADTDIVVHPMGSLTVRENVVPLDLPVNKFGNDTPADGSQFAIAGVTLNGNPSATTPVPGAFARGQFQKLSDGDKLSAPAFEDFHCGVQIGDPSVQGGHDAPRTVSMQWRYVFDPTKASVFAGLATISAAHLAACAGIGAGALSAVKNTGLAKFADPATTSIVTTSPASYVVAGTDDLAIRGDISAAAGTTHYAASAALADHLAASPQDAGQLQVIPLYEVPGGQVP